MKTPSSYPVLDNRPIDQWRVTELKEELKRRKLSTKGLKDDLVRRLDEAILEELESAKEDNGSSDDDTPQPVGHTDNIGTPQPVALDSPQPKVQTDDISVHDATPQPVVHSEKVGVPDDISQDVVNGDDDGEKNFNEKNVGVMHHGNSADSEGTYGDDSVRNVETSIPVTSVETDIERNEAILSERDVQDREGTGGVDPVRSEETLVHATSVEATSSMTVNKSVTHELAVDVQESLKDDLHGMKDDSKTEVDNQETVPHNDVESHSSDPSNRVSEVSANVDFQVTQLETESKLPHDDVKLNSSNPNNQVSEVSSVLGFQVKSDSISSDCVSINEKNELKDNIIDDNVKLELDVRPEMVNPSSRNVLSDSSEPHPMDGEEQCHNKEPVEEGDEKTASSEMSKKNESLDVVSSEKLNLDRSSGDDSMEDDTLENKPTDSKHTSGVGDRGEKNEGPVMEEEAPVSMVFDDIPADKKVTADEIKKVPAVPIVKRKLHDQEGVGNDETSKRPRRWNSEKNLKVPETQSNMASSTTPKELFSLKRNFSKSDSTASDDAPKERVVPPSSKPPTTSLRIDQFLRPFTLKAVQELLGKTGNVTSFWMDHIKTHCYVTYSSVEEAVETRNAVYNLQWPANGGRLLLAEFVDPQEVKMRVDAPPQSPATPVSTGPTMLPPSPPTGLHQATPRQQVQRQPLPPPPSLPLPPPPPLSNPPQARERLPPPPPRPEKIDPPIVTLDDLFRKTKATPRIYYLPLSDEQVAEKLKAQRGRNAKQSAGVGHRNSFGLCFSGVSGLLMEFGLPKDCLGFEALLGFVSVVLTQNPLN